MGIHLVLSHQSITPALEIIVNGKDLPHYNNVQKWLNYAQLITDPPGPGGGDEFGGSLTLLRAPSPPSTISGRIYSSLETHVTVLTRPNEKGTRQIFSYSKKSIYCCMTSKHVY